MCNLYNVTTTQRAIIEWSRAMRDVLGNLEPTVDIYPNYPAPVVRNAADGTRELTKLQWGMPTPPDRVKGKADYGTTNIRRPNFGHWRKWMNVENRCVVPATSFAEPSPTPGDKDPATGIQRNFWFALDESKPLFFFAGIWTPWHGIRRVKDGPQDYELYGFLTTEPNGVVKPIHEKAMPVILTTSEEVETWLTAPYEVAVKLQRPLPDKLTTIVPAPILVEDVAAPAKAPEQPSLF
ncbi:SOS response-associated peptidase [Mesorhizobium sp. KR9-304]|uniref:SOS response-associated peptidase n=1 Tax=Mesorhizobium sp. KR9-304 TaxID=3156614 RepID=UPI0032B3299F